jgi:uncharacterized iron-regulated membrane protein
MAWLHTWAGLMVGWVLFFVFLTGSAGYFATEIGRWMQPEQLLPQHIAAEPAQGVAAAQRLLFREAVAAQRWYIFLPGGRGGPQWRVLWSGARADSRGAAAFDPRTAEVLPELPSGALRATGGGRALYRMHYNLRYLPHGAGVFIVGICTMVMLLALVTGVIVHKKIFAEFFTFRPGKGPRSWLDAHNLASVAALPFFVMITYSGLVFFMYHYLPAAMHASYGADEEWVRKGQGFFKPDYVNPLNPRANARFDPLHVPAQADGGAAMALADLRVPLQQAQRLWGVRGVGRIEVEHPGRARARIVLTRQPQGLEGNGTLVFDGATGRLLDAPQPRSAAWAVQRVLIQLHEGTFAGWGLRWLYFLSGLLGCAMIATGLILWIAKRRREQDKRLAAGQPVAFGFRLVEALNIGTLGGLCTAVALFFWANRLLPVGMAQRADWEFHCLFITWGLLLLHAALRLRCAASRQVWREQLWLAAGAFGLLPLLNWATTDRHLGVTLPAGDWVLAGFDLTVLTLGAGFAAMAHKVQCRLQAVAGEGRQE